MGTTGTTQLFVACTQYAAVTVTAAIRSGLFGERSAHRRVLVVSDPSTLPEVGTPLDRMPGFEALRPEFDAVHSWNDFIQPFHPGHWSPRDQDTLLWERALRRTWGLGRGAVEIACESIQGATAQAMARIFQDSPLHIYADGLMSYGPTRGPVDPSVGARIKRLLYVDLVPGLRPLLLAELGVEPMTVPTEAMKETLTELSRAAGPCAILESADAPVLLLGQYLSAIGVLSPHEEQQLHLRMLRGAARIGHKSVVFKPHPSAPPGWSRALERDAEHLGVEFRTLDTPVLAEVVCQRLRPALIVSCFSTALFTASCLYGLPVARVGTGTLLERLTPYQNSNRVPVTIVDALLPDLEDGDSGTWWFPGEDQVQDTVGDLVRAVGFVMQPEHHSDLRPIAERYLSRHLNSHTWRYFKRQRLTRLGLPGAAPARLAFVPRTVTVRRTARRVRALKRAVFRRA
ncbi:polysialyltransferase family glycosyltransferase [Streptomyces sp. NPDC059474]|uniref:polysialyltransferase family glycosyltransferase n=1 Tax=Streptomyces sp. NPDC059474 TaxID=3346846 RepID=UPI003697E9D0